MRVFGYSLTSWNGIGAPVGQGFRNFGALVHDSRFLAALRNNVIYAHPAPIEVIGALVIAYLLHERIPGWRVFRSAFFLPAVYSTVVIGIIAGVILQTTGPIDNSLRTAGLSSLARNWLGSPADARTVIIAIVIWANFGYSVLIYLAGMSALDPQLGEAARMDGAGSWYILFRGVRAEPARRDAARPGYQHGHGLRLHVHLYLCDYQWRAGVQHILGRVLYLRQGVHVRAAATHLRPGLS